MMILEAGSLPRDQAALDIPHQLLSRLGLWGLVH